MPGPERIPSPEPLDPLTPRSDDLWIGRWWWARPLYRREHERPVFFRWPITLMLMLLLLGLVALGIVILVGPA